MESNYNDILRQGDAAVPDLLDKLNSDDKKTRFWAMALLGDIGNGTAAPALANIVQDPNRPDRNDALRALGNIQFRGVLPVLISVSESEFAWRPTVRQAVCG